MSFIHRLKSLGLCLAEIRELNAVHAIRGSTTAMLARLRDLLDLHVEDLDRRIAELAGLRADLLRYREHIESRPVAPAAPASPSRSRARAVRPARPVMPAEGRSRPPKRAAPAKGRERS